MEPSAATTSGNLPAADQTNDYQKKVKKSKSIGNVDGGASRCWSFTIRNRGGREESLAIRFTQLNRR
uniref:Uncharacterized protein n=2 Tax=Brassica campestris TaxID=3711 RepID=M4E768_BRACM